MTGPFSTATASRKGKELFICLVLLALIGAVYWPVCQFDFVNYDDGDYVYKNLSVQRGLTAENLVWAFRTSFFGNRIPLTWLSYMLDYRLFGLNPGAFHVVNVLFHALNSLLLFLVFKMMTGAHWRSAFLAAVFAVHPLHVESVAWVSERKDVLSGFFWILALWAYVGYVKLSQFRRYALALLFFACCLMAKPMVVTLPFVLLLFDFWPLRRIPLGGVQGRMVGTPERSIAATGSEAPISSGPGMSPTTTARTISRLILEKVPFFILTIASSILTFSAQQGAMETVASFPITQRLSNAVFSYGRYLGKTFWPENLAFYYPYPAQWPGWQVSGAGLLLLAITVLAVRQWRKLPYLAVGWLLYLGTLFPVIGLVQVGRQSMADRYMYLPMIGLAIMTGWGAAHLQERFHVKRLALILSSSSLILCCAALSSLQLRCWKNSVLLCEHALAVTAGSTVAHNNLGAALLAIGQTNRALAHFSAALAIDPKESSAYNNLGMVLFGEGKLDEAVAQYQAGLKFNRIDPELNHNMGVCLVRQGKFYDAIPYFSTAVHFSPELADAYLGLGTALVGVGKFDEGITNFDAVLRLRPGSADAHLQIGIALTKQGKDHEASGHYLAALRFQPVNVGALVNLAFSFEREGKINEAIPHLTKAVGLKPGEASLHFHLAGALMQAGDRTEEGIREYQEVLRIDPDSVLALNNLGWTLATHPDAKIRNGAEAVRLAERACELAGRRQAQFMGTLAAAYAEAGRLGDAISTAEKAVALATASSQKDVAARNEEFLQLYRAGKPFHEKTLP